MRKLVVNRRLLALQIPWAFQKQLDHNGEIFLGRGRAIWIKKGFLFRVNGLHQTVIGIGKNSLPVPQAVPLRQNGRTVVLGVFGWVW